MWAGLRKEDGISHILLIWALGELLGMWVGSNCSRIFFLTKLERIFMSLKCIKVIIRSLENTWRKTLIHMALYATNPRQFRDMNLRRGQDCTLNLFRVPYYGFHVALVFSFVLWFYLALHLPWVRTYILIWKVFSHQWKIQTWLSF